MNLRRAMAVAAATGVLAPAVFLSAPAAFADESPGTDHSSPASSETDEPAGQQSSSGATAPSASTTTASGTDSTSPSTPTAGSTSATPSTGPTASTSPTESTGPTASTGPTPSGTAGPSTSAGPVGSPTGEPGLPTDNCPTGEYGLDWNTELTLAVKGLTGKIVAGSGWHTFSVRAANTSDQVLDNVRLALSVTSSPDPGNEKLDEYVRLQFQDKRGRWTSQGGEGGGNTYVAETTLRPNEYVDLKLRLDISAQAPLESPLHIPVSGAYPDLENNCWHNSEGFWGADLLAPGSDNDKPGHAEPVTVDRTVGPRPVPQGGADEIPATGSLAETGSSSATPVIAVVGGIAVLAGAGVVFAMKRRKNGASA